MMLILLIAESALEAVPRKLWPDPYVVRNASRRGKEPGRILLDRSYHHRAMLRLRDAYRRGRPDIVHMSLLQALGSPLNREGMLRTYVHTIQDYVIDVDPSVRLPKNYDRFVGLIEQLFEYGQVPPEGPPLLRIRKRRLPALVEELQPDLTIAFTREGAREELEKAIHDARGCRRLLVIVGGFPRGHFSEETKKVADRLVCIDKEGLEAYVVIPRIIYEYERALQLPRRRLQP